MGTFTLWLGPRDSGVVVCFRISTCLSLNLPGMAAIELDKKTQKQLAVGSRSCTHRINKSATPKARKFRKFQHMYSTPTKAPRITFFKIPNGVRRVEARSHAVSSQSRTRARARCPCCLRPAAWSPLSSGPFSPSNHHQQRQQWLRMNHTPVQRPIKAGHPSRRGRRDRQE